MNDLQRLQLRAEETDLGSVKLDKQALFTDAYEQGKNRELLEAFSQAIPDGREWTAIELMLWVASSDFLRNLPGADDAETRDEYLNIIRAYLAESTEVNGPLRAKNDAGIAVVRSQAARVLGASIVAHEKIHIQTISPARARAQISSALSQEISTQEQIQGGEERVEELKILKDIISTAFQSVGRSRKDAMTLSDLISALGTELRTLDAGRTDEALDFIITKVPGFVMGRSLFDAGFKSGEADTALFVKSVTDELTEKLRAVTKI